MYEIRPFTGLHRGMPIDRLQLQASAPLHYDLHVGSHIQHHATHLPIHCCYLGYIYLHKKQQTVKKGASHAKKQHEKSCGIKGDGPEVAVVV